MFSPSFFVKLHGYIIIIIPFNFSSGYIYKLISLV